nr:CDP-alcohol phosphatidyltransferase family protein [uncultured Intestinibacter sp.]
MCGILDVLDGFIARKFNVTSKLGAKLDSIPDYDFCYFI